jgi:hypothetical protein
MLWQSREESEAPIEALPVVPQVSFSVTETDEGSRAEEAQSPQGAAEHASLIAASPDVEPEPIPAWELALLEAEMELQPPALAVAPNVSEDPMRDHAVRTVAALEQWLAAIHVARPQPSA